MLAPAALLSECGESDTGAPTDSADGAAFACSDDPGARFRGMPSDQPTASHIPLYIVLRARRI
jgi:hypothetical protein